MVTKEAVAKWLHGREIGNEITKAEEVEAKNSRLVVIFGGSDDLMEFRGAVNDEIEAYEGVTARFTPEGLLKNECEDNYCPYFVRILYACKTKVEAIWDMDGISWQYRTDIIHATFDIMEDGDIYCRGIVIELPKEEE